MAAPRWNPMFQIGISAPPFDTNFSHRVDSPELEELAVTFALVAQSPEERVAYLEHLEVCDLCRQLAGQFQATADLLPSALEEQAGSPSQKRRLSPTNINRRPRTSCYGQNQGHQQQCTHELSAVHAASSAHLGWAP